ETVQVTRLAGVRQRGAAGGQLTGSGLADDPLVFALWTTSGPALDTAQLNRLDQEQAGC
ncbi:hypothetical protein JM949_35745, partial [Micromonospora sp. STR1s_6]|nr:hypothetical protein [Micromonospora tarensis]